MILWWDVIRTQWWLHSTTSSYERAVLKAAYEEMIIHFTEIVWEILAWEEWLGCRHDTSPMVEIPGSTPVWAQYMVFFDFTNIKVYMYYVLKTYMFWKKHWWSLTLSYPDVVQRTFLIAHDVFLMKKIHKLITISLD